MSGLKSAWELSLERSDKMVPELKKKKKLTKKQTDEIAEIRRDYQSRIADKDVTTQDKLNKLSDRIPPEEFPAVAEELKMKFSQEKKALEKEMEAKIDTVRNSAS